MAFIQLPGIRMLGLTTVRPNSTNSVGRTLVSGTSTGSRMAMIVRVPKSGMIERVRFALGTCTAVQDVRIALQDITNNSNLPDNVEDAYTDQPAADFVAGALLESGILSSDGTSGGTRKTVVAGDALAITLRWVGASGTLVTPIMKEPSDTPAHYGSLAYNTRWGGAGNWFGSDLGLPHVSLVYTDGSVESPGWFKPYANLSAVAHSTSSTPDEYGIYYEPQFTGLVDLLGFWPGATSTAPIDFSIYEDTTLLARYSAENRELMNARLPTWGRFDAVQLTRGQVYRLTCRPGNTSNMTAYTNDINASERAAGPFGPLGCLTTRANDGAFTETITKIMTCLVGYSAVEG